ncbi:uncharacterized protein LOC133362872 [Lethenteron reissneri]|uniref:uncharacterized protein LOC133362872 n=1 Tax=Lethenteron reissneri TaxID=7753 RepID=UPI002AB6DB63|nr:uncharacterized protein LOC133362872 [Lethenteron reissneri]
MSHASDPPRMFQILRYAVPPPPAQETRLEASGPLPETSACPVVATGGDGYGDSDGDGGSGDGPGNVPTLVRKVRQRRRMSLHRNERGFPAAVLPAPLAAPLAAASRTQRRRGGRYQPGRPRGNFFSSDVPSPPRPEAVLAKGSFAPPTESLRPTLEEPHRPRLVEQAAAAPAAASAAPSGGPRGGGARGSGPASRTRSHDAALR